LQRKDNIPSSSYPVLADDSAIPVPWTFPCEIAGCRIFPKKEKKEAPRMTGNSALMEVIARCLEIEVMIYQSRDIGLIAFRGFPPFFGFSQHFSQIQQTSESRVGDRSVFIFGPKYSGFSFFHHDHGSVEMPNFKLVCLRMRPYLGT